MTAHSTKSYDHILMDCSASLAVVTYSCTWGTFLKGGSKGSWDPFDSFILFFFSSCDTLAVKMKVLLCFYCYALTFIDFYKLNNFFSSSLLALPFLLLLFAHPPFFSSLAITLDQTWSHLFVTHTNAFFPSISGRLIWQILTRSKGLNKSLSLFFSTDCWRASVCLLQFPASQQQKWSVTASWAGLTLSTELGQSMSE